MTSKNFSLSSSVRHKLLVFQKDEITAHYIYAKLSNQITDPENRNILHSIAGDELKHAELLKKYTGANIKPNKLKIFFFYWISRLFGLTFGLKLLERNEEQDQIDYRGIEKDIPEIKDIIVDEECHEQELLSMINETGLTYVGSIVLGLNDALVELTGTLAGLTFAFQNTKLIALSGIITGIAASLSMAVSDYLSKRAEGGEKNSVKSAVYTGIAYIITVALLVLPYLFFQNYFLCLGIVLSIAILIILVFNFYISVAKDYSFRKRFLEMSALSLGVAIISFGIGYLLRVFVGVDV